MGCSGSKGADLDAKAAIVGTQEEGEPKADDDQQQQQQQATNTEADEPQKPQIDASRRNSDVWWTAKLEEEQEVRKSTAEATATNEAAASAAANAAAPTEAPEPRRMPRTSRNMDAGPPAKAKHMTTAQLRRRLSELGVPLPEGASKADLEALLAAASDDSNPADGHV